MSIIQIWREIRIPLITRYLEDECAKLSKTVALVHPSSVEMCKFMSGLFLKVRQELFADVVGAELKECLESLNLADAHYVFIPVNDNEDATSVGGTHWYFCLFLFLVFSV